MSSRLKKIVSDDLCIGCGACIEICPPQAISATYSSYRGAYEVEIKDTSQCEGCTAPCVSVCPSDEVDFVGLLGGLGATDIDRVGPVKNVFLGSADKYVLDGVSSSGGIIRQIIASSIEKGKTVVCLGSETFDHYSQVHDDLEKSELLRYRMIPVSDNSDLGKIPGSIYHAIDLTNTISILKEIDGPLILVAIPCQLEGLHKYIQQTGSDLLSKIDCVVGVICGWMYTDHSHRMYSKFMSVGEGYSNVTYRGDGEAGALKFFFSGLTKKYTRRVWTSKKEKAIYSASYARQANRLRCRTCQNHTNILADISVGDAWLAREEGEKKSIIVARTDIGSRILSDLSQRGAINLESASRVDIEESQSADLVYGHSSELFSEHVNQRGLRSPIFRFGEQKNRSGRISKKQSYAFDRELKGRALLREGKYGRYISLYILGKVIPNVLSKLGI